MEPSSELVFKAQKLEILLPVNVDKTKIMKSYTQYFIISQKILTAVMI